MLWRGFSLFKNLDPTERLEVAFENNVRQQRIICIDLEALGLHPRNILEASPTTRYKSHLLNELTHINNNRTSGSHY